MYGVFPTVGFLLGEALAYRENVPLRPNLCEFPALPSLLSWLSLPYLR
jgi:hypothetical protein